MRKNKVNIITLGCSKNLVDSEQLMRQFVANGYTVGHNPHKINSEIVVANTCGFIGDAQEEFIDIILRLGEQKQKGRVGKLFAMDCLSERFLKDLEKELPEVDRFYGKFNWKELISDLGKSYHQELTTDRMLTTPRHCAYMKIGEGCNHTCSYCSIPIIAGACQSHLMDETVDEVHGLVTQGVEEFQMIAQDLMFYGPDRYKRVALPELVEWVSDISGMEWIRLHYGYPSHFPYDLLPMMRKRDNVRKYMDIAFQYVSDPMLRMIRRNITKAETYELPERIRREVPGIHLRTTLMVGHPGKTGQGFEELIRFVKDTHFGRMGASAHSHEEGTYAYQHYKDEIPQEVKRGRLDYLMRVQEGISADVNASKIGQTFRVIVGREEGDFYMGRTQYDSSEIDLEILISKDIPLSPGSFYQVKVIDAQTFDLYGKVLN